MRLAGIDVRLHALAVPFQALVALAISGGDLEAALPRFASLAVMLLAVLVHELAHGFVARARGLAVFDVRIHGLGGVARIERPPPGTWRPRDEWIPALAGPLGNLVVGGAAAGALAAFGAQPLRGIVDRRWVEEPATAFVFANLSLGALNLVPAFPSDGGRVLRALLAGKTSYLAATRIALGVGVAVVATGLAVGAFWGGPKVALLLAPVALLLGLYALQEYRGALHRAAYAQFCAFVDAHVERLPILATLPRDPRGLPMPDDAVLADPAVRAAWIASRGGPTGAPSGGDAPTTAG